MTTFTRKFSVHLITLVSTSDNILIFQVTSLFYISIKVEYYRSNKIAQCFACQRFDHLSVYCGFAFRCVKCSGPHLAKNCTKPQEVDPKYLNCIYNSIYMANYTKCPTLLKEKEFHRPKRRPKTPLKFRLSKNVQDSLPHIRPES